MAQTKYLVGEPGGLAGPYCSIVTLTGQIVTLQVLTREQARTIICALEQKGAIGERGGGPMDKYPGR